MKRFILLCAVLVLALSVPVLAVEETAPEDAADPVTVETITKEEEGVTVNVTIQQPEAAPSEEIVVDDETDAAQDVPVVHAFSVTSPDLAEAVQPDDVPANMVQVVTAVLGEYQRQTYTVQEVDAEGNVLSTSTEYVPGLAGLDYHWIAGAVLFVVFLLGIFKLLGGVIRS